MRKKIKGLIMAVLMPLGLIAGVGGVAVTVAPEAAHAVTCLQTDNNATIADTDAAYSNAPAPLTPMAGLIEPTSPNGLVESIGTSVTSATEWNLCEISSGDWSVESVNTGKYLAPIGYLSQYNPDSSTQNAVWQITCNSTASPAWTNTAHINQYDSANSSYDQGVTGDYNFSPGYPTFGGINTNFTISGLCGADQTASECPGTTGYVTGVKMYDSTYSMYVEARHSSPYKMYADNTAAGAYSKWDYCQNTTTGLFEFINEGIAGTAGVTSITTATQYEVTPLLSTVPKYWEFDIFCTGSHTFKVSWYADTSATNQPTVSDTADTNYTDMSSQIC